MSTHYILQILKSNQLLRYILHKIFCNTKLQSVVSRRDHSFIEVNELLFISCTVLCISIHPPPHPYMFIFPHFLVLHPGTEMDLTGIAQYGAKRVYVNVTVYSLGLVLARSTFGCITDLLGYISISFGCLVPHIFAHFSWQKSSPFLRLVGWQQFLNLTTNSDADLSLSFDVNIETHVLGLKPSRFGSTLRIIVLLEDETPPHSQVS